MSDLLYQKQSQLEKMAAERSAQHLAWEQQLTLAKDDAEKSRRYGLIPKYALLKWTLQVEVLEETIYQTILWHDCLFETFQQCLRYFGASQILVVPLSNVV